MFTPEFRRIQAPPALICVGYSPRAQVTRVTPTSVNRRRRALYFFPFAYPAAGVPFPVKFLRQLFLAPCALLPAGHCGCISSKRLARAQAPGACRAEFAAYRVASL